MKKGLVFDIKRNASSDGRGIRTVVFLKGCPLRCEWCANPESQSFMPEIMYYASKCVNCRTCINVCVGGAIYETTDFGYISDMSKCTLCMRCIEKCYYNARELMGKVYSAQEIIDIAARDKDYYDNSNGGITISGGEPLSQADFCAEILRLAHERSINTAIETCGYTDRGNLKKVIPFVDEIMFDVKHIDSKEHIKFTGKSNQIILDNLDYLSENYNGIITVRIPFIPYFNGNEHVFKRIFQRLSGTKIDRLEILPYHRLGSVKCMGLGRTFGHADVKPVCRDEIARLSDLGTVMGLNVFIDASR